VEGEPKVVSAGAGADAGEPGASADAGEPKVISPVEGEPMEDGAGADTGTTAVLGLAVIDPMVSAGPSVSGCAFATAIGH